MPNPNVPRSQRLRYWFDNLMSTGALGLIVWLSISTLLLLVIIALIASLTSDGRQFGLGELLWMGLLRTLDPGTMGGDSGSWPFLLAMLAFTVGGIFVVSSLIGILTTGLDAQINHLRKGRSIVIEHNHTVILGWSPQIFSILSELAIANENQKKAAVAILADKDKVEMEDEIAARIGRVKKLKIVCRTGSPIDPSDLEIINPSNARSIIVLTPENTPHPDVLVLKTILALTNRKNARLDNNYVVAELRNPSNLEVGYLIGNDRVTYLDTDQFLVRLTAQTCRQSGLSVIYTDLLDFEGDEIYFQEEPDLVGKTYADALFAYEDSSVIGIHFATGEIELNPSMATVFQPQDQVIAISRDDDTVRLSGNQTIDLDDSTIQIVESGKPMPERTLVLGWNHRAPRIIRELDSYVAPGSELLVVAGQESVNGYSEYFSEEMDNQSVRYLPGNINDRKLLNGLAVETYQHIILLGYSDELEAQEADARTLLTLLHLRDLAEKLGRTFSIVSEMQDLRNRVLAEIARADDFIVSERLISLALTQISENRDLATVFQDLFDPEGSEIYLKGATDYVEMGKPMNFYTAIEACRRHQATAIGYRVFKEADLAEKNYGVHLNPNKKNMITFERGDRIIMLSER